MMWLNLYLLGVIYFLDSADEQVPQDMPDRTAFIIMFSFTWFIWFILSPFLPRK